MLPFEKLQASALWRTHHYTCSLQWKNLQDHEVLFFVTFQSNAIKFTKSYSERKKFQRENRMTTWLIKKRRKKYSHTVHLKTFTLCEMCPNTEFFLVSIFPYWDWIRSISPYSFRKQENTDQKKLRIWTLFRQCQVQNYSLWNLKK